MTDLWYSEENVEALIAAHHERGKKRGSMTQEPTLDQLVEQLAQARAQKAAAVLALDTLAAEIEQYVTDKYGAQLQNAKDAVSTRTEIASNLDSIVRDRAVLTFEVSGNKKPNSAVQIKEYTVLVYAEADALEFARQHVPKALKLDKRAFERAAKALESDFVTVITEPRATIASDLSAWLPQTDGGRNEDR